MSSDRLVRRRSTRLGAVFAFAALTLLAPVSLAQTPGSDVGDGPHPAHIHSGTCAELGDVVVPLSDVAPPEGEHAGAASAIGLKLGLNLIDMPLHELLDGAYAVNVHKSAEEIDVYIACGDIGGVIMPGDEGEDEIRFVLKELNSSGHTGVVFLEAEGDQTEVNIMLIEPDDMS
jgi:hypothetical protein